MILSCQETTRTPSECRSGIRSRRCTPGARGSPEASPSQAWRYSNSRTSRSGTQENFCNSLRPIEFHRERTRSDGDPPTDKETSQYRGLVMKAQWRAVQTGLQYSARVGIAAAAASKATVAHLKEANSLMRELRKTAKEDIVYHAFNFSREDKLSWDQLVAVHFGDAGHNNRPDGGSTGGYVTVFSDPKILQGQEAKCSVMDWRSFKLDRPVKGTNGSEGQALFEAEDKGYKCRLFWALMNGHQLHRSNAKELASLTESLLVTDSRGLYDAITSSDSPLLGMSNTRTGLEASFRKAFEKTAGVI